MKTKSSLTVAIGRNIGLNIGSNGGHMARPPRVEPEVAIGTRVWWYSRSREVIQGRVILVKGGELLGHEKKNKR